MSSLALVLAVSLSAPPAAPPAAAVDGPAALERLRKLEGSWKTDAKAGPVQYVTYRLVAGGSAVLEMSTGPDRTAVSSVTLYHLEGSELVATHHGPGGASRLKPSAATTGALKLEAASKDTKVASLHLVTSESKLRVEVAPREGGKRTLDLLREYVDTLK